MKESQISRPSNKGFKKEYGDTMIPGQEFSEDGMAQRRDPHFVVTQSYHPFSPEFEPEGVTTSRLYLSVVSV